MPNGTLYRDGSGQSLGRVAPEYYTSPVSLVDIAPFQQALLGTVTTNGVLTVTPA